MEGTTCTPRGRSSGIGLSDVEAGGGREKGEEGGTGQGETAHGDGNETIGISGRLFDKFPGVG